jgi:cell shape-determining protein MreD
VFFSLNFDFQKTIRFAIFLGLLKDLINPNYILLDTFIYVAVVIFIFFIKKVIIFENIFLRMFLVVLVSALYFGLKTLVLYFKSNFIPIDTNYPYFILLNLLIFLIFNQFVENYKERDEF